jgi:RNA-binding protein 23/39
LISIPNHRNNADAEDDDSRSKRKKDRRSSRSRGRSSRSRERERDDRKRHDDDRKTDRRRDKDRRSRSRDKSRDRDRDRSRDRDRDRSRDRDRDRDRSRRDRDRDRDRERSRRHRSGSREPRDKEIPRDSGPAPIVPRAVTVDEAEARAQEELVRRQKELDDLTKDQRTVFVSQLTMKVTEKDVREFFTQLGKVNNVIMIRDKYTGRHKGFCYVEMAELESIPNCLLLNGIPPDFQKFPILVKASEAEKNFLARKDPTPNNSTVASGRSRREDVKDSRIYIGNLHVNISEDDLEAVLSQFGRVESVHINRDEVGTSKGFAFGKYSRGEDAATAISKLSGLELAGRAIKVGYVNETTGGNSGGGGAGAYSMGSNWKLDDDEGNGMQMNAQSRVMLMAKLGQAAGLQMPNLPPAAAALMRPSTQPTQVSKETTTAPPVSGDPSPCFCIKNMFSLEEETEPNWDEEIKEDVTEECRKFGAVTHCHVEKNRPGGYVFLKFASVQGATTAANSLNGRWFAGKMITCSFMHPNEYMSKFGV